MSTENVSAGLLRLLRRFPNATAPGSAPSFAFHDLRAPALAPEPELLNRCGAERVAGAEDHLLAFGVPWSQSFLRSTSSAARPLTPTMRDDHRLHRLRHARRWKREDARGLGASSAHCVAVRELVFLEAIAGGASRICCVVFTPTSLEIITSSIWSMMADRSPSCR